MKQAVKMNFILNGFTVFLSLYSLTTGKGNTDILFVLCGINFLYFLALNNDRKDSMSDKIITVILMEALRLLSEDVGDKKVQECLEKAGDILNDNQK